MTLPLSNGNHLRYLDYMNFLVKQIPSQKMRVKVVWLGPNADFLVRKFVKDQDRRAAGRSIMFFAWRPSTITQDGAFISLSFPQCETLSSVAPDNGTNNAKLVKCFLG